MKNSLLYTKMKIFHFRDKIDSLPPDNEQVLPPVHVRIKPTNACNHNCRYCSYRLENVQLGQDMSSRDFIPKGKISEIIEDFNEIGVKAITFSGGGEPFCYPFIVDALNQLAKTKIKFAALTNGSYFCGEVAEIFSQYGTWVRISIDGWDDESYSYYRRVPSGEFAKVMKNIKDFKKMGNKCYLGISFIIDKYNAGHVYEFIKMMKDLGINSIKVSPCIISNDGKENNEYHKSVAGQVKDQIQRAKKELEDKQFEIFDAYHELDEKFKKDYTWCPYLQVLTVIGADLNVYSCQDKAYNLEEGLIGSIKNVRFKDFWFSDKTKFFKINPSVVCNHHCVTNLKNKLILDYLAADEGHLSFI